MKSRWPCHTPLGRTWTLPAIIHEHYVVFAQLLCWLAEQQSSASNRKGDNSLYKSSSARTQGLLAINVAIGWIHKYWWWVMQPWGPGKCQKFLPHLQEQNMAELCKTDAFQQLNPFPCCFSFFLQTQSFAATGFHVLVVQQEQERPWRGAWRDIRARKSKSQCPCHCCVQAGGRAGRALALVGSKARRCPSASSLGKRMVVCR